MPTGTEETASRRRSVYASHRWSGRWSERLVLHGYITGKQVKE